MSGSRAETTEIEGLLPWAESGDLAAILRVVAEWYDAADGVDARIELKPWDVHLTDETLDLQPMLRVVVSAGERGGTGHAVVEAWRGATARNVADALLRATGAAEANRKTRAASDHPPLAHVPADGFEVGPGGIRNMGKVHL